MVLGFRNSETSLAGFGVPKFGNFLGCFWGSEIRKLWLVLGFRNSETSLAGFGVPKFGNFLGCFWGSEIRSFFGWFWGSEIRKLWLVLGFRNSETLAGFQRGFRNSETSLAGFGVPKFGNFFSWFWGSKIRKLLWVVLGLRNSKGGGRNASNNLFLIISELRSSQNLEVKLNQ